MPAYPTKTPLSVPFTATLKTGPIASTTQQPLLRICLSAPAKSKAPIVMYFRKGSRSQEHGGPWKTLERWWRCELLALTKRGRIIGSASAKGQPKVTRTFNCTQSKGRECGTKFCFYDGRDQELASSENHLGTIYCRDAGISFTSTSDAPDGATFTGVPSSSY